MLDNRQFVIANHRVEYPGFEAMEIALPSSKKAFLTYSPKLRIVSEKDLDGTWWYLLGEAYSVDQAGKKPCDDIRALHTSAVVSSSAFWTGRWVLIGDDRVIGDASGMLALHYHVSKDEWYISSSLRIISLLTGKHEDRYAHEMVLHWYGRTFPVPLTKLEGILRLPPNQTLRIGRGTLETETLERNENTSSVSFDEKCSTLCHCLKNAVTNLAAFSGRKVYLGLTCGYDSRTLLAALLSAKVPFHAYTFDHRLASKGDIRIPQQMAADLDFPHALIRRQKPDAEKVQEYEEQTLHSNDEADRYFYACSQFARLPEDAVIIKGEILQLLKGPQPRDFTGIDEARACIFGCSPDNEAYRLMNRSYQMYFDGLKGRRAAFAVSDQLYLDHYVGGWCANLMASTDIIAPAVLQIANCTTAINTVMGFSKDERVQRQVYRRLYNEMCESVARYPFNPPDRRQRLRKRYDMLRDHPWDTLKKAWFVLRMKLRNGQGDRIRSPDLR